jgi:hypothetical protein
MVLLYHLSSCSSAIKREQNHSYQCRPHWWNLLSLLVVWAHYVLGLTASVLDCSNNTEKKINFGQGEAQVIIVISTEQELSFTLLEADFDGNKAELFHLLPREGGR